MLFLVTLWQIGQAYRRFARAFFRVEREMAWMELMGGLARGVFLLFLLLGLWVLVGPGVLSPSPAPMATLTPAVLPSPTEPVRPSPRPGFLPLPSPTRPPVPTLLPSPSPTPSPTPTATPAVIRAHCPDPNAQLEIPVPGQVISQPLQLIGTATHPAFQFYKVEINGPYTGGQWVTLGDVVRQPVVRGSLWFFDPQPFFPQPGRYRLRVVVVDIAARDAAICEVPVLISP